MCKLLNNILNFTWHQNKALDHPMQISTLHGKRKWEKTDMEEKEIENREKIE